VNNGKSAYISLITFLPTLAYQRGLVQIFSELYRNLILYKYGLSENEIHVSSLYFFIRLINRETLPTNFDLYNERSSLNKFLLIIGLYLDTSFLRTPPPQPHIQMESATNRNNILERSESSKSDVNEATINPTNSNVGGGSSKGRRTSMFDPIDPLELQKTLYQNKNNVNL
jgi:hypothetical protein